MNEVELQNSVFAPIAKDREGFLASPLLGKSLRLVEAAVRQFTHLAGHRAAGMSAFR